MPELPDILVYQDCLRAHLGGEELRGIDFASAFLLRSVEPPAEAAVGRRLQGVERLGKQLVFDWGEELYFVLHLMIAGRLRWREPGRKTPSKTQAGLHFGRGDLWITEASAKKRARLHVVEGAAGLADFRRAGIDVREASVAAFAAALRAQNRTLKRALTDPDILDGIGNAWSDEILFAARLPPLRLTSRLSDAELACLHEAARTVLAAAYARIRAEVGEGFPEKVTAFRPKMKVHGRYREPCLDCGKPIQRIRYASNECNYCAQCQNQGRLLADRGLSQLMRKDWPKTLEDLEERRR